jgi:CheY-like chemotaxis protein
MNGFLGAMGALFLKKGAGSVATDDAPAKTPVDEASTKCTILAIDDEADMLDLLRPLLRAEGYNVLTAQSGPKGLDLLRYAQRDVGVVLLDYNMPRFSGSDTLQYLRKLAPRAKVVACTGIGPDLLPEEFRNGVDRFLPKPFRAAELIACIQECLAPVPPPVTSAPRN